MMKNFFLLSCLFLIALSLTGCMDKANGHDDHQMQAGTTSASDTKNEEKSDTKDKSDTESPVSSEVEIIKDDREGIVPVSIEIPAINVKTKVEHVGTLPDGRMGVPKDADHVGWYKPGAEPGAPGNSVIAGHVDDLTSPAVFYNLHKLKAGDEIIVHGKSGESVTFKVKQSNVYPRQDAPIKDIFGFTYRSMLNLITCTGEYNPETTERAERLVVSAELVQDR